MTVLKGFSKSLSIKELFHIAKRLVILTGEDKCPGFILCGPPGWGKTSLVKATLRQMGIEPVMLSVLNAHALVHSLMKQPCARFVVDDSEGVATPTCANVVKAAFGPDREVVWDTREAQKKITVMDFDSK